MRINTVKEKWDRGDVTFGAWLSIPSSFSAEVMAHQGFDWVCIDMQHGVIDYQSSVSMIQAIELSGRTPVVRVTWNEPGLTRKQFHDLLLVPKMVPASYDIHPRRKDFLSGFPRDARTARGSLAVGHHHANPVLLPQLRQQLLNRAPSRLPYDSRD